jgi:hypothetical protein
MNTETHEDVSSRQRDALTEILDTHAKMETQVGEIYINLLQLLTRPELDDVGAMALEEGDTPP